MILLQAIGQWHDTPEVAVPVDMGLLESVYESFHKGHKSEAQEPLRDNVLELYESK